MSGVEWIPDSDPRVALPNALNAYANEALSLIDISAWERADPSIQVFEKERTYGVVDRVRDLRLLGIRAGSGPIDIREFETAANEIELRFSISLRSELRRDVYAAFHADQRARL